MDYKAVIEEQIKKLQEVQDKHDNGSPEIKINLAKTITSLATEAANLR